MQIPASLVTDVLMIARRFRFIRATTLKDKAVIYGALKPGNVYIIEKGYVCLKTVQANGSIATRALLGTASIFGDLPFCPSTVGRDEIAVASGQTQVLRLERTAVEAAVQEDETVRQILLEVYGFQYRLLERRLEWQFFMPLQRRVAAVLLDLMSFGGTPCTHHPGYALDIRLTHQDLSEIVLAARSNVTPILNAFRAQNLISYTRAHICLRTIDGLSAIAGIAVMRHHIGLRAGTSPYPPMYAKAQ